MRWNLESLSGLVREAAGLTALSLSLKASRRNEPQENVLQEALLIGQWLVYQRISNTLPTLRFYRTWARNLAHERYGIMAALRTARIDGKASPAPDDVFPIRRHSTRIEALTSDDAITGALKSLENWNLHTSLSSVYLSTNGYRTARLSILSYGHVHFFSKLETQLKLLL